MKVEGEAPVPDTVAVPWLAADETDHVSVSPASTSVAPKAGALHAVGLPSSDMVTLKGPAPCVMTGASFTALTVTLALNDPLVSIPSFTVTGTVSVPLKLAAGVIVLPDRV